MSFCEEKHCSVRFIAGDPHRHCLHHVKCFNNGTFDPLECTVCQQLFSDTSSKGLKMWVTRLRRMQCFCSKRSMSMKWASIDIEREFHHSRLLKYQSVFTQHNPATKLPSSWQLMVRGDSSDNEEPNVSEQLTLPLVSARF